MKLTQTYREKPLELNTDPLERLILTQTNSKLVIVQRAIELLVSQPATQDMTMQQVTTACEALPEVVEYLATTTGESKLSTHYRKHLVRQAIGKAVSREITQEVAMGVNTLLAEELKLRGY